MINVKKKSTIQTVFGFDFGTKRIGVAVGQCITRNARPLVTLSAKEGKLLVDALMKLEKLMQTWQPDAFVVGIPLNMDGTEQPVTQAARVFAEWLHKKFALPVYEMDERLSTRDARAHIFATGGYRALQKAKVDSHAAQIILQNWLDAFDEEE